MPAESLEDTVAQLANTVERLQDRVTNLERLVATRR
jgi:hypothetical protein